MVLDNCKDHSKDIDQDELSLLKTLTLVSNYSRNHLKN